MILSLLFLTLSAWCESVRVDQVRVRDVEYRVVELDPKQVELKLYWKKPDGSAFETLTAVREHIGKNFIFATNSGIYAKDWTPLGLHIERGQTLRRLNRSRASSGNFFVQPNGVFFLIAGGARILATEDFAKANPSAMEAAQSGPLLLRRGVVNSRFHHRSENLKLRSGVGVSSGGHVFFAASESAVSFYDFAQLFKNKLRCTDALYLDGTISAMLIGDKPAEGQLAPFVGIWAATAKP